MAQMDARIILAGQPVNALGALNAGTTAAANANQVGRDNAMSDLFRTQGAGILSGDAGALNALAGLDPMAALDVRSTQQQMSERQERLAMARTAAARQAQQAAAQMSQQEREAEAAQIRQGLLYLSPLYSRGDRAAFEAGVQELDPNGELGISWDNFESQAAMADGVLEVLESFDARNAGPERDIRSAGGGLYDITNPDAVSVLVPPQSENMSIQVAPDGTVNFVQGTGVDPNSPPPQTDPSSPEAMIATIDGILNDPALPLATGFSQWTQNIPGTGAARFGARMDQLQGQAFLNMRESLRGSGAITDYESQRATDAFGRVSTAQSPEDLRAALTEVRDILMLGIQRMEQGQPPAATPQPTAEPRMDAEGRIPFSQLDPDEQAGLRMMVQSGEYTRAEVEALFPGFTE